MLLLPLSVRAAVNIRRILAWERTCFMQKMTQKRSDLVRSLSDTWGTESNATCTDHQFHASWSNSQQMIESRQKQKKTKKGEKKKGKSSKCLIKNKQRQQQQKKTNCSPLQQIWLSANRILPLLAITLDPDPPPHRRSPLPKEVSMGSENQIDCRQHRN